MTKFTSLFIFLIVSYQYSFAQNVCNNGTQTGGFRIPVLANSVVALNTIDYRLCNPGTVSTQPSVAITTGSTVTYDYNYDGITFNGVAATTRAYPTAGTFTIAQRIADANGTVRFACRKLEVVSTPPVRAALVQSCVDREVIVILNAANPYPNYLLNWGDNSLVQRLTANDRGLQLKKTYANTQVKLLTISTPVVANSCNPAPFQTTFTPIVNGTPPAPVIQAVTMQNAAQTTVIFQQAPNTTYEIFVKDGANGTYKSAGPATSPKVVVGLDSTKVNFFQVVARNTCNKTSSSLEIPNLRLNVVAENNKNTLSWNAFPNSTFRILNINRTGGPITPFVNTNRTEFIDTNIECGVNYTYQVQAQVGNVTPVVLSSQPRIVKAISDKIPAALTDLTVNVLKNQATLSINIRGNYNEVLVARATETTGKFEEIARIPRSSGFNGLYTDPKADPSKEKLFYQISYTNLCNIKSDTSAQFSPIFLDKNYKTTGSNDLYTLNWTPYRAFRPADRLVSYVTEYITPTGTRATDINGRALPPSAASTQLFQTFDPLKLNTQQARIRIKMTSRAGVISYSNEIDYAVPAHVFIPDAFSPDNSGLNDVLEVKGFFIKTFKFTVFNRWGQAVYASEDRKKAWDATINGAPADAGSYAYTAEINDFLGARTVKTGKLVLIR